MSNDRLQKEITMLIKLLSNPEFEASRLIDARIHCVLHPDRIVHERLPAGYTMTPTDSPQKDSRRARSPYIFAERGPSPHYTKSLDDAILVVPKTPPDETPTGMWDWQLEQTNGGLTISARVGPQKEVSFADTPAVALCIAALKARLEDAA